MTMKIPFSKLQAPGSWLLRSSNSQAPNGARIKDHLPGVLNLGAWCFSGAWLLALGVFTTSAQPKTSLFSPPLFFEGASETNFLARGQNFQIQIEPAQVYTVYRKLTPINGDSPVASSSSASPASSAKTPNLLERTVRMQFVGARAGASIGGQTQFSGRINYLVGNDPAQWRVNIPTYAQVNVNDLYPGISVLYYGTDQRLEYDLTVAPGADPSVVQMRFDGANRLEISKAGEIVLHLGNLKSVQPPPRIYQMNGAVQEPIIGAYRLKDAHTVQFSLGKYDKSRALIIDPVLVFSSYFGGNYGDTALAVKVDTNGFVYMAGETRSTSFKFPLPPGGFSTTFHGGRINGDAFVAKFDHQGSNLLYFTYVGGSGNEAALDLAVDDAGHAYIAGFTDSDNFPVANPITGSISGVRDKNLHVFPADAFVAELNTNGSGFIYSTYLGGAKADAAVGIAVDPARNAYLTGYTFSKDFPIIPATAVQPFLGGSNDVFLTKIASNGQSILYSTYLGGTNLDSGEGIAVDPGGVAYIAGFTASTNFPLTSNALQSFIDRAPNAVNKYLHKKVPLDAFVSVIDTTVTNASSLRYSTFLGGTNNDAAFRIALDSGTNAFIVGNSNSRDYPDTNHVALLFPGLQPPHSVNYDAFLTKLSFNTNGAAISYSTLFGGTTNDVGWSVAVDAAGDAFVVGSTRSKKFPTNNISGLLRGTNSGHSDVFVMGVNSNASELIYSAYLGGLRDDFGYGIAVDPLGNAYVVGKTLSTNFPTVAALQGSRSGTNDAFLAFIQINTNAIVPPVIPPVVPPLLTATLAGANIQLSWPDSATGFSLQSNTNLLAATSWSTVTQAPVDTNATFVVTLPATNDALFFRLKR
jgi:hypothetical protein